MYSECLPFTLIPHTTPIFRDFLYNFSKVQGLYPEPPRSAEWALKQTPDNPANRDRRRTVAAVLERQNRSWGAGEKALANVRCLGEGARAVVAGQQVGLFGGPVFTVYKALTAIKYAQEFSRAGVECVPVFWMASEDHDLAEVNHLAVPGATSLQVVSIAGQGIAGAPVGGMQLGNEVEQALRAVAAEWGEGDLLGQLRNAYRPERTFGAAFARLMAEVFAPYGLVLVDSSEPELHAIARPIFSAVIQDSEELNREVQQRGRELESAGYHEQVKVTTGSGFLFLLENGAREPIKRNGGGFTVSGARLTEAALLEIAEQTPERLSPNALLRACMQDFLLPTILYIGGPAEIAYWAQSAPLQLKLLGRVTPIAHRFSATLVEPVPQRLLKKYGITLPDVFGGPEKTREKLAARVLPQDLQSAFQATHAGLQQQIKSIQSLLEKLDHTLVEAAARASSKMEYQLDRLRGRASRAELRRNQEIAVHADRLSLALWPNKDLQERTYPGAYFLSRYGNELLDGLLEQVRMECPDHQVVTL